MKKNAKIALYIAAFGAAIFGVWLLKKGFYDTGYADAQEERLFLIDMVLNLRGLPVTESNRKLLERVPTDELLKELGLKKDENGDYVDLLLKP